MWSLHGFVYEYAYVRSVSFASSTLRTFWDFNKGRLFRNVITYLRKVGRVFYIIRLAVFLIIKTTKHNWLNRIWKMNKTHHLLHSEVFFEGSLQTQYIYNFKKYTLKLLNVYIKFNKLNFNLNKNKKIWRWFFNYWYQWYST